MAARKRTVRKARRQRRAVSRRRPVKAKMQQRPQRGKTIAYLGLLVAILMFILIPVSYIMGYITINLGNDLLTVALSILFPFSAFSYMYFRGQSTEQIFDSIGLSKKHFSWNMVLLGVGIFLVIFLLELLIGAISVATGVQINTNAINVLQGTPLWFLLFVSFIAPLDEEIFFRGFAVPRIGIVLSALIFGLLHASYGSTFGIEIIAAFIFGLLAGYAFKKTGSLYPGLTAHILVNFLTVSTILVLLIHP